MELRVVRRRILAVGILVGSVLFGASLTQAVSSKGLKSKIPAQSETASAPSTTPSAAASEDSVWISRPDGSTQCAAYSAQSLEKTQGELLQAHIRVLESRKKSDGKIRIQMCGAPTGSENAFRIPRAELSEAMRLGFKPLD